MRSATARFGHLPRPLNRELAFRGKPRQFIRDLCRVGVDNCRAYQLLPDRVVIAPYRLAMVVEQIEFVLELRDGYGKGIPAIRMFRDNAQGFLLTAAAKPDRRVASEHPQNPFCC
jgi:hypothetical protein